MVKLIYLKFIEVNNNNNLSNIQKIHCKLTTPKQEF